MSQDVSEVGQEEIVRGLRELGLASGAGVMVHSSLSSFGYVRGGARTVIEALMEVLGAAGTLMMPSFNHGLAFAPGGPGYYDPRETPTNDGAIADLFWRLPGVHRSLDPTHAFAAWGRHASDYTQFHHRTLTAGPESPLGLLWRDGGFGLLLGAEYSSNTFHHVVETVTGAPCLGPRTEVYPVRLGDGRFVEGRTWGWRSEKCPLTSQGAYVAEMRAQGLQREGTIGRCRGLLFPLQGCFDVVADLLRRGTGSAAPCSGCAIRPRTVPQTVPSDWDVEHGCLRPDSTAWGY